MHVIPQGCTFHEDTCTPVDTKCIHCGSFVVAYSSSRFLVAGHSESRVNANAMLMTSISPSVTRMLMYVHVQYNRMFGEVKSESICTAHVYVILEQTE